jgi:ribosomal protein L44E
MKCPVCGELSRVVEVATGAYENKFTRQCDNGHVFSTVEVHKTQLADAREMACAIRRIKRRVDLYARNNKIIQDKRSNKEIAKDYGLTESRVRQIRASSREFLSGEDRAIMAA